MSCCITRRNRRTLGSLQHGQKDTQGRCDGGKESTTLPVTSMLQRETDREQIFSKHPRRSMDCQQTAYPSMKRTQSTTTCSEKRTLMPLRKWNQYESHYRHFKLMSIMRFISGGLDDEFTRNSKDLRAPNSVRSLGDDCLLLTNSNVSTASSSCGEARFIPKMSKWVPQQFQMLALPPIRFLLFMRSQPIANKHKSMRWRIGSP